ncbi:pyruvate kinase [Desulfomarina sp.]
MLRRTKIVATLGPSTVDLDILGDLIRTGADVVRLNLSHGSHEDHRTMAENVRDLANQLGRPVGILVDLQGPKIRIGCFENGPIQLRKNDSFILDTACHLKNGTPERVGLTFPGLIDDVTAGDILVLNDGAIVLRVEKIRKNAIHCRVRSGGTLSDNKGINKLGGGLSAPALTDKDREDIGFAASISADYLAVSFVRNADDIHTARKLLIQAGGHAGIVAKIERAEAMACIGEIIKASQAIMIARGDLGVEIGDAELPAVQKQLIRQAQSMNKVVITATQMMESMITNPIPTRAEVFDVANAVIDGTDAVMLSAETAAGQYPVNAVRAMDRICREAEKQDIVRESSHRMDSVFGRIDEAIAMAAMYTANHLGVAAIAALTESGSTPKWMSCINSSIPIMAITNHNATKGKVTLFRGVYPLDVETADLDSITADHKIIAEMLKQNLIAPGDTVIITRGDRNYITGGTNSMKIITAGKCPSP